MTDNSDTHSPGGFTKAATKLGAVVFTVSGAALTLAGAYAIVTGKGRRAQPLGSFVKEGKEATRMAGVLSALFGLPMTEQGIKLWTSTPDKPASYVEKISSEIQGSTSPKRA